MAEINILVGAKLEEGALSKIKSDIENLKPVIKPELDPEAIGKSVKKNSKKIQGVVTAEGRKLGKNYAEVLGKSANVGKVMYRETKNGLKVTAQEFDAITGETIKKQYALGQANDRMIAESTTRTYKTLGQKNKEYAKEQTWQKWKSLC